MNTVKWGPSGWDQHDPMAYRYDKVMKIVDKPQGLILSLIMKLYICNEEHQLPCKYCRLSYHDYIREDTPDQELLPPTNLHKWMYKLHNKVNDKLRKQGYNNKVDPTFKQAYDMTVMKHMDLYRVTGWHYIHSIAHNYAEEPTIMAKLSGVIHFSLLPYILPHPLLTVKALDFLRKYSIDNALDSRASLVLWVYLLHIYLIPTYKELMSGFTPAKHLESFTETCKYYEKFRAGCGKSKGKSGPSCRLSISSNIKARNLQNLLKKLDN